MTRLNDYLRAERPDETEPASFYIPGAKDWSEIRKKKRLDGGAHEEQVVEDPLDTTDTQDIDTIAAAERAAAVSKELDS